MDEVKVVGRMLRAEIAAATRLLAAEHILDYSGHVSARLLGRDYC